MEHQTQWLKSSHILKFSLIGGGGILLATVAVILSSLLLLRSCLRLHQQNHRSLHLGSGDDLETHELATPQLACQTIPGDPNHMKHHPYFKNKVQQGIIVFGHKIGEGSFAYVFEASVVDAEKMEKIAVKLCKHMSIHAGQQESSGLDWEKERNILEELPPHPNIVKYLGYGSADNHNFIVQEKMAMDLRKLIQTDTLRASLTYLGWLKIFIGVSEGLKHLEDNKLVHYDLKPPNILLKVDQERYHPCVADFGLSQKRMYTYVTTNFKGTRGYMAPEVWNLITSVNEYKKVDGRKVDVFSFGIVIWACLTGQEPRKPLVFESIANQEVNNLCDQFPQDLAILVKDCAHSNYKERPSWEEIIERLRNMQNAPWINDKIRFQTDARPGQ